MASANTIKRRLRWIRWTLIVSIVVGLCAWSQYDAWSIEPPYKFCGVGVAIDGVRYQGYFFRSVRRVHDREILWADVILTVHAKGASSSITVQTNETGFPWISVESPAPFHVVFQRSDGTLTEPLRVGGFRGIVSWHDSGERMTLTSTRPDFLEMRFGSMWYGGGPLELIWQALARAFLYSIAPIVVVCIVTASKLYVRRQRRFECPECGYDLRHLDQPGCPECGWQRPDPA
jgi:predicted RNA-binding Zn-ribbon protein involved in translation (DUF1610 family)